MSDGRDDIDKPATLLVVGPSQHGKSTFINKLRSLSAFNSEPEAAVGTGNFSCTTTSKIYNLDLPLSGWTLIDNRTGRPVEIPDDEEQLFDHVWQRSKGQRMRIVEDDPNGPRLKLRLIDTPGLDDSEGRDNEHIFEVLSYLNDLAKSDNPYITGVVFICNVKLAFTKSFQKIYKYYEKCMPNLFGSLIVVNTNFSVVEWEKRHETHLGSLRNLARSHLKPESAKDKAIHERAEVFKKMFNREPVHFFIDNKPNIKFAFEDYATRATICDFLSTIDRNGRMPIKEMRLIKQDEAIAIDEKLAGMLHTLELRWERERKAVLETVSKDAKTVAHFEKRIKSGEEEIKSCREKRALIDNDTEYSINTYTTQDDISMLKRAGNWIIRSKIENTLPITEDVNKFMVRTTDRPKARWLQSEWSGKTWKGKYSADPGYLPLLTAKSYTYNRIWYADQIDHLTAMINRRINEISEDREELDRLQADSDVERNPKISALNSLLVKAKVTRDSLLSDEVPLDKGFGPAARTRYRLLPSQIGAVHLYEMTKERHADLAEAVKEGFSLG